jgi:type IV secretory pathway VirJ component
MKLISVLMMLTVALVNSNSQGINPATVKDLPLVEEHFDVLFDRIAVILTGDGGWAKIDREIGNYLSKKSYAVVGFNTLEYYSKKKDPVVTANDVGRVINFYDTKYNIPIVLIGYSLGADVLPFALTRLDVETLKKVRCAIFLGITNEVSFEFYVTDWIGGKKQNPYKILPEVEKIRDIKTLYMGGEKETDTLLPKLDRKKYNVVVLLGGHHFDNNYSKISEIIADFAK